MISASEVGDKRGLGCDEAFLIAFFQQLCSLLDLVPYKVVEVPHRRCWTVEALLLQKRIELILLALVMDRIPAYLVVEFQPLVLDHRILHKVFHGKQQAAHLVILLIIMCEGMVCGKLRTAVVHEPVQHLHHLAHIYPDTFIVISGLEVLLHVGNVIGADAAHLRPHHLTGFLQCDLSCLVLLFRLQQSLHLLHLDFREKVFHLICHNCY